MKNNRRRFLQLTAGAAVLAPRALRAETYPVRPVHWIVCFAAGGPNDIVARLIAQFLSEHSGSNSLSRTGWVRAVMSACRRP
jgi:tripartite-type tricarboxylate transporter receptor subunit TctC